MTSWRAFLETLHIGALALWLGTLTATGAAAAILFPTLRSLAVRIPGYESAPDENYLIAGGNVAQRLFLIADMIMFACCVAALVCLGVLTVIYKIPLRRPAAIIRTVALAAALAAFASMLFIVTPSLNAASRLHWAAIKAADPAAIAVHRAAVDQLHPIARNLMAAMAVAVLVAFVAAVRITVVPWNRREPKPRRYPEPELLRSRT